MEMKKVDKKRKQVDLSSFYKAVEDRNKTKERELQKEQDHVIEELFGDGPELGQDDDEEAQEVQLPTSLEPPSKGKKQRRWIPAWKLQHKWAYPVIFEGKVRVKCEWCVYSKQKTPYANNGSSTLQLPALTEHSESDEHQIATFKWANKEKRVCIPLPDYVATLEDKEKVRVITVMWQVYFVDAGGEIHVHSLRFDRVEGSSRGGSFEECMLLGKELVTKIVENLTSRMQEDMPILEACKLFSPKHYPSEELVQEACTKKWLLEIFKQYGCLVSDIEHCLGELDSFTTVLSTNFKHRCFRESWEACKDDATMHDSFPNLMRLWQILSIVPVNTAPAERGFSLQNNIKSAHRTSMSTTTLENYMFVGLNGPAATSDVPWDDVFSLWRKKKKRSVNLTA